MGAHLLAVEDFVHYHPSSPADAAREPAQ